MKLLGNVIGTAVLIYFGTFIIWVMLISGCVQANADQCGGDTLTRVVQKIHSPFVTLLASNNEKN